MPDTAIERTSPGRLLPRDIVWDWNGTLLDDAEASLAAFNTLLRERNLRPVADVREYRAEFSFPVRGFYAKRGFDLAREDWNALADRFHALLMSSPARRLAPDAVAALSLLRGDGARQWVLSALRQDLLEADLDRFGVRGFFSDVFGSDNLDGAAKNAQAARLAAEIARSGGRAVLIGDTVQDFETARDCGMDCVLVACGHQNAERLRACGAPVFSGPLAAAQGVVSCGGTL